MLRSLVFAVLFLCASLSASWAEVRQQDPASASSQKPASETPAPQTKDSNAAKPKPKKVWTNDNLADAGGTINVVGSSQPSAAAGASARKSATTKSVDPQVIRFAHEQLQKLEAQLALIDKQIADLKDFGKGESKGTGSLSTNTFQYNTASVDDQIKQLQAKRAAIESRIDAIFDAARQSGVEPGQLR